MMEFRCVVVVDAVGDGRDGTDAFVDTLVFCCCKGLRCGNLAPRWKEDRI